MTLEPCPTTLSAVTVPWDNDANLRTWANPKPVPRPSSLVVKNGSKMRGSTCGAMPSPLSCTVITTQSPSLEDWLLALIVTRPLPNVASRALNKRLSSATSSCAGSASINHSSSAKSVCNCNCGGKVQDSKSCICSSKSRRSIGCDSSGGVRPSDNNCRTNRDARCTAR